MTRARTDDGFIQTICGFKLEVGGTSKGPLLRCLQGTKLISPARKLPRLPLTVKELRASSH